MKVWAEPKTGADGAEYSVRYLLDIEELNGLQSAGIIGPVSEIVGMQEVADCLLAGLKSRFIRLVGGVVQ